MSALNIRQLKAFANAICSRAEHELAAPRRHGVTSDFALVQRRRLHLAIQGADYFIKQLSEPASSADDTVAGLLVQFECARDALGRVYEKWRGIEAGKPALSGLHALLDQLASLHDKCNTLCWLIREREADRDRVLPGVFSSADDLFAAMGV